MTVICDLRSFNPIFEMSLPSKRIFPLVDSSSLVILFSNVDLPHPDLPTIPIFSLALIVTVKFLITGTSYSGKYFKSRPFISIFAALSGGQSSNSCNYSSVEL